MKNPNIRSRNTYWKENWEPIEIKLMTFSDSIEVVEGIEMIHTGGHSDGHSIIIFKQNGRNNYSYGGYNANPCTSKSLWVLAYDDYPMTSVFAKEKWVNEALQLIIGSAFTTMLFTV